uniref:Uncharacterized protein n=1 Tax=Ailuropoda melanoleuca TaxID=9646 RepID=A0A7N5JP57_AILME
MSVPVEQLEVSIPQGYSLFIKTIFQARSFTEPLELRFEVQIEYLASFPTSPRPCGQPPYIWSAPLYLAIRGKFSHSLCGEETSLCCY